MSTSRLWVRISNCSRLSLSMNGDRRTVNFAIREGGRHTPFYNGYRPQFYLRTTDVTGAIGLPAGAEMIMPGDNVDMTVELITPIALEVGQRFAIREGGRTVGAGAIVNITE